MITLDRLQQVANARLGESKEIGSDTTFEDLGFDSLDSLDFWTATEAEFGVEIPEDDLCRFATIGDIAAWLEAHC